MTKLDTQKTMMYVLIALVPALIVSTVVFGPRALLMTAVCIVACVFFEWAYEKLMHRPETVKDLSAALTGTLIAFNVPSSFPYWMAIIGCFVAIVIVKMLYGGIGQKHREPGYRCPYRAPVPSPRDDHLAGYRKQLINMLLAETDATTGATALGVLGEIAKERQR